MSNETDNKEEVYTPSLAEVLESLIARGYTREEIIEALEDDSL